MIIYRLHNTISGKSYIGQTVNALYKRLAHHRYLASNPSDRAHRAIHAAIAKYGWPAFSVEVLEQTDRAGLDMAERFWIATYNSIVPNGYNLDTGGQAGNRYSPGSRARMSAALKGRTFSDDARRKMAESSSGKCHSDSTRKIMSEQRRGTDNGKSKLNWEIVREMRRAFAAGEKSRKDLAVAFDVTPRCVGLVIAGKTWIERQ